MGTIDCLSVATANVDAVETGQFIGRSLFKVATHHRAALICLGATAHRRAAEPSRSILVLKDANRARRALRLLPSVFPRHRYFRE